MGAELTGQRFGRLTILGRAPSRGTRPHWRCRCDCGNEREIQQHFLSVGRTKSCGCKKTEEIAMRNMRHGAAYRSRTYPEYSAWAGMIQRCTNARNRAFPHYGGRGIFVCDRWKSFNNFLADLGRRPSSRHSIERDDNDRGYSPDNCRWALPEEQAANRRTTVRITMLGRTMSVAEWRRLLGVGPRDFTARGLRAIASFHQDPPMRV